MGNVREASGVAAARREGAGCVPRRQDVLRGAAVHVWGHSWGWSMWGTCGPGQGCMGRIVQGRATWNRVGGPAERAGRVPGGPGRSWGAVWVQGALSACGTCRGALMHMWGRSTVCGTCLVHGVLCA